MDELWFFSADTEIVIFNFSFAPPAFPLPLSTCHAKLIV